MGKLVRLDGMRFNRLLVIERSGATTADGNVIWKCVCDCGNEKNIKGRSLTSGATQSCGCLHKEYREAKFKLVNVSHGMRRTPVYRSWMNMKARCLNPNHGAYKRYGGRGITVCARWIDSFENFYEDMGDRPEGMTLDRERSDGNYEKANCRWATKTTQANNRSSNRMITFDGKHLSASEWARVTGLKPAVIIDRLNSGWTVERALTEPKREQ